VRRRSARDEQPGLPARPLSSWEGTVYQFIAWTANLYLGNGFVVPEAPSRTRETR
jgi:hypothetical protein